MAIAISAVPQLPSLDKQRPEAFAVLDLELTRRFLEYGADLLAGRLDPKEVAREWYNASMVSEVNL